MVDELRTDVIDLPNDGWAPHLRIGIYTALLTISAGLAVLVGWAWIGGFGVVLGLVADVAGMAWLRQRYGAVIPRDAGGGALLHVLVAAVMLAGIGLLINYT
jgi:hypothetical protein